MNIGISAAETSGDLLGSKLVKALKKQNPKVKIEGLAGDKMQTQGCDKLWDKDLVNVMGFSEVIKKLPSIWLLREKIISYFYANKPDVFIGVDAPDFNFKIEKKLKERGVKTVHFVSPSIWAWRQKRIEKIKKSTDLVLCLFPFETEFYQKHQQKALFVGHPLAQTLSPRENHISGKNILLMPGSRSGEIRRLLPEMLAAMLSMSAADNELNFHLVLANDNLLKWVKKKIKDINISISIDDAHARINDADLVICASGTATLEVALIGVPMVVVYKLSLFSYLLVSRLLKAEFIALPNIIKNKALVPELVQYEANAKNIARYALWVMGDDNNELIAQFSDIHKQLKQSASDEAACAIIELINE